MTDMKFMQRITTYVNGALMGFVIFALFFFSRYGITYMVYHSIPTLFCYIGFFALIRKGMLYHYAMAVYLVITIYMVAGNLCLGYSAGYHLYCISLVPLSFYMVYMAQQLNIKRINPLIVSLGLIVVYLVSSVYVVLNGPVYQIDATVASASLVINSVAVFAFLVGYAGFTIKMVTDSEQKLTEMANKDRLTGLPNRNYMMSRLTDLEPGAGSPQWLAIADIDDFKMINDTYGHSCGDQVLVEVSRAMQEVLTGCTVCRWGGEEFLILSDTDKAQPQLLEQLRRRIQDMPFSYQGQEFAVTVTVGVSAYQPDRPLDNWVRDADDKLYEGKASGKNKVIY